MEWIIRPLRLVLYMVKGSFITADDIDGGAAAMDTEVWSKLPEELIWEVVRLVPAGGAAHFRWQSVSRKWRQVLTSANFRSTLMTTAAAASRQSEEREQKRQPPVVAGVEMGSSYNNYRPHYSSSSKVKVLEIDLTSILPHWFWTRGSYTVETAADGLVCISNDSYEEPEKLRFCVLNPLTRTYTVLPHVPGAFGAPDRLQTVWLHPSPTRTATIGNRTAARPHAQVSIFSYKPPGRDGREAGEAHVATYDLGGPGGSGGKVWRLGAAHVNSGVRSAHGYYPGVAMCGGETYLSFGRDSGVRVLAPAGGGGGPGGGTALVEAAALDKPSVTLLGLDASMYPDARDRCVVDLVAHRGAVLYVEELCGTPGPADPEVVLGVWRLARKRERERERLRWEAVAWLDVAELERVTGVRCGRDHRGALRLDCDVRRASGVREVLYCTVFVDRKSFKLGLNLDTGEWKLVLGQNEQGMVRRSRLFELRPDVFLL